MNWWFTDSFSEKAQKLFGLLFTKEFSANELIKQLEAGLFSIEDINAAAFMYVYECNGVDLEANQAHLFDCVSPGETLSGIESAHLSEAIKILLDYGLDPNKIYCYEDGGQANIMEQMVFVYNGYQAADALALMLEHGGNPNLIIEENSLIRSLNEELLWFLVEDEECHCFSDSVVHYWMVCIGYGAKLETGEESIDPIGDFDITSLRNHRQYYCGIIHSDNSNDRLEICFFDKDTNWEVARF